MHSRAVAIHGLTRPFPRVLWLSSHMCMIHTKQRNETKGSQMPSLARLPEEGQQVPWVGTTSRLLTQLSSWARPPLPHLDSALGLIAHSSAHRAPSYHPPVDHSPYSQPHPFVVSDFFPCPLSGFIACPGPPRAQLFCPIAQPCLLFWNKTSLLFIAGDLRETLTFS